MDIVLGSDKEYLKYACVTMLSVFLNSTERGKITFFVLMSDQLSRQEEQDITFKFLAWSNFPQIKFVYVRDEIAAFTSIKTSSHVTSLATYARLLIPVIFKRHQRVVYLDSDIIVDTDISPLFLMDLGGKSIAGVEDSKSLSSITRLALPPSSCYINAGVIIFNMCMIADNYLDNLLSILSKHATTIIAGDQDILALMFSESTHYLPLKWNVFAHERGRNLRAVDSPLNSFTSSEFSFAFSQPAIYHFIGKEKPWAYGKRPDYTYLTWYKYARHLGFSMPWYSRLRLLLLFLARRFRKRVITMLRSFLKRIGNT